MKIVSLDPLGCKQGVFAPARCIMNKMVRREAPEILAENQSSSLNLRKKSVRQGNRLNLVLEFPTLPYPLPNLHLPYPLLFCSYLPYPLGFYPSSPLSLNRVMGPTCVHACLCIHMS